MDKFRKKELLRFRQGAPDSGRGKRAQSVGSKTFSFEDHNLGNATIPKDNIAAWRAKTGIMILSDNGIEASYIKAKKERVAYKGARGLKIMLGRWVCQRTVQAVNRTLNQDYPLTFFEEDFNPVTSESRGRVG